MTAPRKYPHELRDRAMRPVREDGQHGAIARIADRLDINRKTLRNRVNGDPPTARGARSPRSGPGGR